MLTTLRIKNLALASDLTVEFSPGYNAITGETGAGKSVLIGGLKLLLGERADRTLVRSGADQCTVEAVFTAGTIGAKLVAYLEEHGLEGMEDGQLVLKRTFSLSGSNRQFVNGSPASLAALAGLGDLLVDMHGPHDHQSLLNSARQLELLDAYGRHEVLREAVTKAWRRKAELAHELSALVVDERTYAQQVDLLSFQVSEIEAARLREGEEEEVIADHRRAVNGARLLELAQGMSALLEGEEGGIVEQMGQVGRLMQQLRQIDPAAGDLAETHEQVSALLTELELAVSRYVDGVEVDPARLAELEERLGILQNLKRKYGTSVGEILAFGAEAKSKLEKLLSREVEMARINRAMAEAQKEFEAAACHLTAARRKVIPKLSKAVVHELEQLAFARSQFGVSMDKADSSPAGNDLVDFQFAPNQGEPERPLKAIASSGEMARVMLAIKTVLAAQDEVPLLVFDEVDANVGGETAHVVGRKMGEIGARRQVLCITHLAPVAASAQHHFVVEKTVREGRTISEVRHVHGNERVDEITRMLGGGGPAARKHAEALLKTATEG